MRTHPFLPQGYERLNSFERLSLENRESPVCPALRVA
jgi:hypothetical protein